MTPAGAPPDGLQAAVHAAAVALEAAWSAAAAAGAGQAAVNGLIMGAVIMSLYLLQKLMEGRGVKYDMAVMMGDEIRSALAAGSASRPSPIICLEATGRPRATRMSDC